MRCGANKRTLRPVSNTCSTQCVACMDQVADVFEFPCRGCWCDPAETVKSLLLAEAPLRGRGFQCSLAATRGNRQGWGRGRRRTEGGGGGGGGCLVSRCEVPKLDPTFVSLWRGDARPWAGRTAEYIALNQTHLLRHARTTRCSALTHMKFRQSNRHAAHSTPPHCETLCSAPRSRSSHAAQQRPQ